MNYTHYSRFLIGSCIALILLPWLFQAMGSSYLISTATRLVIFAIAAVSLDLLIGYTGLVSFGHAAFLGVGAYTVGILSFHAYEETTLIGFSGTLSGLIAIPLAIVLSALVALIIGSLSLRTKGVYFIMITLSFGQMLFFLFVSLEKYGGDDGMMMFDGRNTLPGLNLNDRIEFYYFCLAWFILFFWFCTRLVRSKFGRTLAAIRQNEDRLSSIGISDYWSKLQIFVIAGVGAGLAGALSANHTEFVSPDITHWTRSGDLMIVVILGGMGTLIGPVLGTFLFLLLEEFLPLILHSLGFDLLSEHWRFVFGPILILIVLYAKFGLYGLIFGRMR
ncbi:branched-chain amino acid ABC transporter permease [Rhodobacteraceae bacterium nBUS_22]